MERERTILVVDDETKIAEVLQSYLERAGFQAVCAYNGADALALFERYKPALIVLDLMLPDISGEEVCRRIRETSNVPIIMLTAKAEEQNILSGLGMGADDYITKPFSPRQVVARVHAVLRRSQPGTPAKVLSFHNGGLVIDNIRREAVKNGKPVSLTPNEFKILSAMAGYPMKTFTREELISAALGDEFDGFDRVIDTHIKNLRQKIETDPKSPVYILTVFGVGYRFGGGAT